MCQNYVAEFPASSKHPTIGRRALFIIALVLKFTIIFSYVI